ncbi:MAG: alpha-xylosidase [Streptococcaceae bacterium]|jgi:alpha-glucosidase (family GH31 glycosyl hydrolase)|nr:alpha-xylosidase [Streptococcaceae bacterium]
MDEKNYVKFDRARFMILTENMMRIEFDENEIFEEAATQIVVNREFDSSVKFDILEKSDGIEIITPTVHLYYKGGDFSSRSLFADFKFNFSNYANRWYFGQAIEGNLGGTTKTLDKIDGGCELEDGILSKNGFAFLRDDSLAMTKTGDIRGIRNNQIDLYLFAYGHDYRQALQDFYHLTGETPLLPRYALGNWWSRYYDYTEESYLALMDKFAVHQVPLSVAVIDMGWHCVDDVPIRFGSGWTGYSWNKAWFPDSRRFLAELHRRGLKTTLNVHPADGIRAFEDDYEKVAKSLNLNIDLEEPATFDFDSPTFRETYFNDVHHRLEDEGVDFWWLDWQQGTSSKSGADPLWQVNHYHYKDIQRKGQNDIILSRYAGPGSHRYPIGFSGDTVISWASLNFQPYFTSTASNIGYSWWSHDIGGHMHGMKDTELSLRWLQLGVFSPINRLHSSNSLFTSKEPWHFDAVTEVTMEEFLRLRHALIPYLYSANIRTHLEGRPLIEPMYYEYPDSEEAYCHPNQFMFGTQMMIAPITSKSDAELQMAHVDVWLPEGVWYDFFTGQCYQGGIEISVYRDSSQIPVFVRSGAIVPLDKNPLANDEKASELEWHIFPGETGTYTLFEDENETTVRFDGKTLKLREKNPSNRHHSVKVFGQEIASELMGDFELEISETSPIWDFETALFGRLDIAEIAYDKKDVIYQKLSQMTDHDKQIAYIQQLDNKSLANALFEIIYNKKS